MILRIVKVVLVFALILWAAILVFNPEPRTPGRDLPNRLFEKDLGARLNQGKLVVVDEDESDRFIQEDLSTHDLTVALTFARLKSEILERPLLIENKRTFGRQPSIARVNPTDRKAWQELTLLEMDLKRDYARKHPQDLKGYLDESALDPQATPQAMVDFVDRYPDSQVSATALAHLEHCLCVRLRDPDRALAVYDKLAARHADQPYLMSLMPGYRARAQNYKTLAEKG